MSTTLDPGIGEKFSRRTQRAINHDGTFNVRRHGGSHRHDPYQWLIKMNWWPFIGLVVLFFALLNAAFALGYLALGLDSLPGVPAPHTPWRDFLEALFFSIQTFTSVGYGHIYPVGAGAGALSSLEALVGVLTFALATGLLYGRFSRPTARILFSRTALLAPRPNGTPSLQFRIANQRNSTLVELQARVLVKYIEAGSPNIQYRLLPLERDSVFFFPLNWTLVHDITPESPLYGLTAADFAARDLEILILIKGYDDTFAQDVHARNSYTHDEIEWNRRFVRPYEVDDDGVAVLDLDKIHATEAA